MGEHQRLRTGVAGLDHILDGGLPPSRIYLLQGDPGAGKTTLSLQFLLEGVRRGERVLYVTLSETLVELHAVAAAHGWSLAGLDIYEMSTGDDQDLPEGENTLYTPAEIELGERMHRLMAKVDEVGPTRMVIDSCSELRLLAQTPLRFRRQILSLKQEMVRRGATVVLLENPSADDVMLQSLSHGVIHLDLLAPVFGTARHRLRVRKLREVAFRAGYHDFAIRTGGLVVYPRLVAAEHHQPFAPSCFSSDDPNLDAMLGGGLDSGTSSLFVGPAGSGKSAVSTQFAVAAARRGENVAIFAFDEGLGTLLSRSRALGMDLEEHFTTGRITIQQVDPAELSPGEFVHAVRAAVEERNASVVIIDSLNGFLHAMPEEQFMELQLHELLTYLRQQGVVSILVMAQHGLLGSMGSPVDVTYLADTVLLFRFFELDGRVRKALSVVKRRSGGHEDVIREFTLGPRGVVVGPQLAGFRGVLSGMAEVVPPVERSRGGAGA